MKNCLTIVFFSLIFIGMNTNHAQDKYEGRNLCSKVKSKIKLTKSNNLSPVDLVKQEQYDVTFYQLDLEMSNLNKEIAGWARMDAFARVNIDSIIFELHPNHVISALEIDGINTPYIRVGTVVRVPLIRTVGQTFSVKTTYSGTAPSSGGSIFGGGGVTNATSQSWGAQVTWTLSESFGAMEWFPVKQSLRDKADSCKISLTVPANCKGGSNGVLESEQLLNDGRKKFNWKHNHPIAHYLLSAAIGPYIDYTIYANPAGAATPIMIQNFIYDNPQTLINFQTRIDLTADYLELFSDLYGPYPFANEKYGHCMAPLGGGMEHQTMTTQGFFQQGLTDHELGHQWWGDNVTCSSWADIWVNEGFASYSEYLTLENLTASTLDERDDMLERHNAITAQPGGSVWVLDSLNEGRIFSSRLSYDKGAAIIHTIRGEINNDVNFFQSLKNIQINFADSTASGNDYRDVFMTTSSVNLVPLFEQWYYGEGFPTYNASWRMTNTTFEGILSHTVSQPLVTPTFTTTVQLKLNRTTLPDTTVRVIVNSNNQTFSFPNIGNVSSFQIDPNNFIINGDGYITYNQNLDLSELSSEKTAENVQIFPNPTADFLQISSNTKISKIVVINTQGKLMQELIEPSKSAKIDLSSYANGSYIVSVFGENNARTTKIVVKK